MPVIPLAKPLRELENAAEFVARHIGINAADETLMLRTIGAASRRALIAGIVPASIARSTAMAIPAAITEAAALAELKTMAGKNKVFKSFIGCINTDMTSDELGSVFKFSQGFGQWD